MKLLAPNRVTGAYVYRILCLGIGLIMLARLLPPTGYGTLAAVGGLVGLATPFAGLGYGNLLVKSAAIGDGGGYARLLRTYRIMLTMALPLFSVVSVVSILLFSSQTTAIVLLTCATELGSVSIITLTASVILALGDRTAYSIWLAVPSTARLTVIGLLFLAPPKYHTPTALCQAYLAVTVLLAIGAHRALVRCLRDVRPKDHRTQLEPWYAGMSFSVGLATRTVYEDIDKVMLASYRGFDQTAIYAASYRLVQAAASPALAANAEMYPHFFQTRGDAADMRLLTRRVLARTTAWATAALVGLVLTSPVASRVLGPGYEDAGRVIRLLAFLPILMSIHFVLGDALTGMGMQAARAVSQLGSALANIALNTVLIPKWGIEGAVLSTAISEAVLCASLWCIWRAALVRPERLAP